MSSSPETLVDLWLSFFCSRTFSILPFCETTRELFQFETVGGFDWELECPAVGNSQSFTVTENSASVSLKILTGTGLCTLSLEDVEGNYIPIARSYDGYDWERAGGGYVADWEDWRCDEISCISTLKSTGTYVLRNRQVLTSASDMDMKARFLENASFGTTRSSLNNMDSYTGYIQLQVILPPTSHREFFRRHMNTKWEFNHPKFAASLNPCQDNSTWRRQILTEKDRDKFITVNFIDNHVQITIDGHIRGYVKQLRYENPQDVFYDGSYRQFCSVEEEFRRGIYKVRNEKGNCKNTISDDWVLDFPGWYQPPSKLSGLLPALTEVTWISVSDFLPEYRYTGYIDQSLCSSLPNQETIGSSPVFAQTIDGNWLIYDSRIVLQGNTNNSPIPDGGHSDLNAGRVQLCANVPRTFQNENDCFMATGVACNVGAIDTSESASGIVVCGSPGEVSNDRSLSDSWLDMASVSAGEAKELLLPEDTTRWVAFERQREFVWSEISMKSTDQLRQRTAWALYQIFALPVSSLRDITTDTEILLNYYDIFVRHAFGNYMDILREISYSPLMAESLSYVDSKSVALSLLWKGEIQYPDENFARELMQLFTIGLTMINMDGTPVLDSEGKPIRTYDSDDVMSFARAWTGFEKQSKRSNIETKGDNRLDPMLIKPDSRDIFPKSDLDGGYIGDGYPLCSDLPERTFLRQGAKYRLLGTSPVPDNYVDDIEWASSSSTNQLILPSESALFDKLCAKRGEVCSYPGVVILDSNLACSGIECDIDTVRVVKVQEVFYEYIHIPCVYQTYFQNPRTVAKAGSWDNPTCVSPELPVAGAACCAAGSTDFNAEARCAYAGERMVMSRAQDRCSLIGMELCEYNTLTTTDECPHVYFRWTSAACQIQVKINSAGQIALTNAGRGPTTFLRNDTQSFFRAYWENEEYPQVANGCSEGTCSVVDNSCLCDVTTNDEAMFTSLPSNSREILERLRFGHVPPEIFGPGVFQSMANSDYNYYSRDGSCCSIDTIFEVVDSNGIKRYFKNLKSTVSINQSNFRFRTPVQFNQVLPNEYNVADAEHETDAVLSYLLYHRNTPPFVAYRFIQRFGVSNPSPRYVRRVAEAFRDGEYVQDGVSFGTGEYGDLSSTVAAVLLDREVRSFSVAYDPSFGSMREPIVKVLAFFRALELKTSTPLVELDLMDQKIGQMAHEIPSVFSFFRPEFAPPGKSSLARLAVPEAEVMTSGKVIGLINGIFSAISNGLLQCDFGFGAYGGCNDIPGGLLTYSPSDSANMGDVIKELSTLLTSGRIDTEKQSTILSAVEGESDRSKALKMVLQLLATSPEFHTSNYNDYSEKENEVEKIVGSTTSSPGSGYKAVIHLTLDGGCDSFNMLAPHPSCTLSNEYKSVRGAVALQDTELLPINATGQPCNTFGVHYGLPIIQQLYDERDLLFVANAGVLTQPVNKDNYKTLTETQLFAHNSMQDEVSRLDPKNAATGSGTLGRMAEALIQKGFNTGRAAIESISLNLATEAPLKDEIITVDTNGINPLVLDPPSLDLYIELLNGRLSGKSSGVYGEEWSKLLRQARNQTDELVSLLQGDDNLQTEFGRSEISQRMSLIAQLISTRQARGVDRDLFYVSMGGYDAHSEVKENLKSNFLDLNEAIEDFVTAMKSMGIWDDIVIVQTSDFGRTLTPNSGGGTDHAWGGNYWVAGGGLNGGRVLGEYPSSLNPDQDIGRGRFIPTIPFDSIFNAIADWVGIDNTDGLDKVLPNRGKFSNLFSKWELFG